MEANNNLYRESAWQALSLQQHGQALLTPSSSAWIICLSLSLWVVIVMVVLSTHSFTEKATVIGYISTQHPSISVSPKENVGVIHNVYVKNGDHVTHGQALLSVKRPSHLIMGEKGIAEQLTQLNQRLTLLHSNQEQLANDNSQQQQFILRQLLSAKNQQQAIIQQKMYLDQRIVMVEQDVQRLSGLFSKQLIGRDSLNNAKQALLGMRQQSAQFTQQLADNDIQQAQLQAQHAKLIQQIRQQNTQTALNQLPVEQEIADLQMQQSYTIYATRNGIVTNLHAQTGDDISRFPVLLKLADPNQTMQVQLAVPASAAGFIDTEQSVRVRLDAFPYQKYGAIEAVIASVSQSVTLPNESHAHAVAIQEPVFMVQANLKQDYIFAKGEQVRLKEGMTAQADVVLSQRTLLEWLLSPLYSLKGSL